MVIKFYLKRLIPVEPVSPKNNQEPKVETPQPESLKKTMPPKDLAILAEVQKHLDLAEDHRTFGFYEKAKGEYLAALDVDPLNVDILLALGDLNLEMVGSADGEACLDEAIVRYQQASEVRQEDGVITYKLGVALDRRGKYQGALNAYQQAKEFGYQGDQLKLDMKRLERILKYSE
ncbi:MAG: tetratricopeptide repeat protein [Thermincolia bacterium]